MTTETGLKALAIRPVDCVDQSFLVDNIEKNLRIVPNWYSMPFKIHGGEAWLVSAGPSLENKFEQGFFHHYDFSRTTVFCVKHALPYLVRYGVEPDFCVILDPRPLDEKSTHDVVRRKLFESIPKKTVVMVASMTNPEVTKFLLNSGANVLGWHASSKAIESIGKDVFHLGGGTSSAIRAISVAYSMGFRVMNLIGYDSSLREKRQDVNMNELLVPDNQPKYLETYVKDCGPFLTTGELAAQAQDIERLMQDGSTDIHFRCVGMEPDQSLAGAIFNRSPWGNNYQIRPLFRDVFPKATR